MRSRFIDAFLGAIVLGPWAAMFAYLGLAPLAAYWLDGTKHRTGSSRGASYWWSFLLVELPGRRGRAVPDAHLAARTQEPCRCVELPGWDGDWAGGCVDHEQPLEAHASRHPPMNLGMNDRP